MNNLRQRLNKLHGESGSALILTILVLMIMLAFLGLLIIQAMTISSRAESMSSEASSRVIADMAVDHYKLEVDRIMKTEYGGIPSDLTIVDPGLFMDSMAIELDENHRFEIRDIGALQRNSGKSFEISYLVEATAYNQVTQREAQVVYDVSQ